MRNDCLSFLFIAFAICMVSCSGHSVSVSDTGVTVISGTGEKIRVEPYASDIFHVTAVPSGTRFSKKKSLCVLPPESSVHFEVSSDDETVCISTESISAHIDRSSLNLSFFRPDGSLVLAEDRREFSPIEVDGIRAFTVHQVFESDESEAFFGLGQHQADEWNYKSRNEELYQYNTKISVPFAVSTKRYGILWDSYSFCRWGDPRGYSQIGEVFKLHDADGVEGALTGTYTSADGETFVRRETALAQEFLRTPQCDKVKNAPDGFRFNGSYVQYDGELEPSESGLFNFYVYYAGYMKVYLGGEEVTPQIWRTAWNPNGRKFSARMEAGKRVPIRVEWHPDGDVSYCGLRVLSPVDPAEQAKMSWWGEMQDQIDYYFIAGETVDDVIGGYRSLTGKAPIMPKWAFGYWQSRERYKTQDEVVETLREFRRRDIPVDNIVQDWQYWKDDQWGSHEFDSERYPDPGAMVDSVHAMGGRLMISVWPKFYTNTEHFKEFDRKGWIYQTAVRDSVEDWLGYQQSFYDAYSPGARKLFWEQMNEHLYKYGIDAWWMDASEPNIHDCTDMDYRKAMCGPTALGPSSKYFNAYALMNAQAIYEGQRAVNPDARVFLLTRNGFAGLQRYSTASWSGDIGTRWEDMKAQISAGLNYCLSGIPYWTQDVGGFSVENRFIAAQAIYDATGQVNGDLEEWRELQVRWHQWGIYNPLYRSHGQWPLREPWNIAPEEDKAYKAIVESDRLRYAMIPYIYSMAARVYFDDYTIMRPLVMDFTDDPVAVNTSDEFMFGDAILVCPVYEYGARSREVYLPDGCGWYDSNDGTYYEGGTRFEAAAPYDRIPVYCREGSMVVLDGCNVSSTADKGDGALYVAVYDGADADFSVYEDDGLTYAYERGEFSSIPLHWNSDSSVFTIGGREGTFEGMIPERNVEVVIGRRDGRSDRHVFRYSGKEISYQFR